MSDSRNLGKDDFDSNGNLKRSKVPDDHYGGWQHGQDGCVHRFIKEMTQRGSKKATATFEDDILKLNAHIEAKIQGGVVERLKKRMEANDLLKAKAKAEVEADELIVKIVEEAKSDAARNVKIIEGVMFNTSPTPSSSDLESEATA